MTTHGQARGFDAKTIVPGRDGRIMFHEDGQPWKCYNKKCPYHNKPVGHGIKMCPFAEDNDDKKGNEGKKGR